MLLYIDINDACNLKCATCPRGVRAFPNTSKKMSLSMFRRIVEKGRHDGAYQVGLFNWVEPFLIEDLSEYTKIVKQFGLRCEVASTLSLRRIDGLTKCLRFVDMLWVTISGFEQSTYEINHVGGNVAYVLEHLRTISEAKKDGEINSDILIRFLRFDYNAHEEDRLRSLADESGFRFEVLLGTGHPIRATASPDRQREISDLLGAFSSSRIYEAAGSVCPLIFEHVAVNADGDVYQCSAHGYHPPLRIGSYLDLSREEILIRRYHQPFCNFCDWTRRPATELEKELLHQALDARLGRPIINRLPRLSEPNVPVQLTPEGYQLPKDGH
jgi:MoaA/NifB/PqqE/SkfB family radical SAM enzyme